MSFGDITVLSLQFHANVSFRNITMANHSNYALQNPFTCVLNIMSNTPVLQYYMNPQNHPNAVFYDFIKASVQLPDRIEDFFNGGGGRTAIWRQ